MDAGKIYCFLLRLLFLSTRVYQKLAVSSKFIGVAAKQIRWYRCPAEASNGNLDMALLNYLIFLHLTVPHKVMENYFDHLVHLRIGFQCECTSHFLYATIF